MASFMKQITNYNDLVSAFKEIKQMGFDEPHMLRYKADKEKRKDSMSRLYYHWIGEIAEQTKESKDYWRGYFKWHIGCPILARNDPEFNSMIYQPYMEMFTYEEVIKAMGAERKGQSWIPITSIMDNSEMSEFLTDFRNHVSEKMPDIILTDKDDIYFSVVHNAVKK